MNWIDILLKEVGGEDILADMLICESPEYFSFIEFNASKSRLKAIGKYTPKMLALEKREKKPKERRNVVVVWQRDTKRFWTPEEDDVLKNHFNTHSLYQIGKIVGRSLNAVNRRAFRLGLNKKQYIRSIKTA